MPALYIRGIGGIGKSTLAAKLLDRPGADLDATLVIRCNELLMPVESLAKLAHFWQAQGLDKHAEAVALLMDELPRLKDEPLTDKLAVYRRVGGHPKTVELLDGWLSDGRRLRALLEDPALGEALAEEWERYFLDDLLGRLTTDEREAVAQGGETWSDERIEGLARGDPGVVGQWTHQTQDMARARWAVARALAWQGHLFQTGQFDAAGEIVNAVIPVLGRWGQRDQAKALLRRSIEMREGPNRAAAQGNLATLFKDEGRLVEALAVYQQVYETFAALDAKEQMSSALNQIGTAYLEMGEYDQAIESVRMLCKLHARLRTRKVKPSACTNSQCSTG